MKLLKTLSVLPLMFIGINANAALLLSIDDPNNGNAALVISDNSGSDFDGSLGEISYSSAFFEFIKQLNDPSAIVNIGDGDVGNWRISSAVGASNPAIGSDTVDQIHFNSMGVSSGAGDLILMLTQTDMPKLQSRYGGSLGGTTDGNISFELFMDDTNTAFGTSTLLYSSQTYNQGGFSDNFGGGIDALNPYSMTLVVTISHTGSRQVTSFGYDVKIPEPATLALFGAGLLGLGFTSRRRKQHTC